MNKTCGSDSVWRRGREKGERGREGGGGEWVEGEESGRKKKYGEGRMEIEQSVFPGREPNEASGLENGGWGKKV